MGFNSGFKGLKLTVEIVEIVSYRLCTEVLVLSLRERDYLADPSVDGRIILRWIFRKWDRGMDWIELAEYRNRWRTLVKVTMNFRFQTRSIYVPTSM